MQGKATGNSTAVRTLESLGFEESDRLEKFLASPRHQALQSKFNEVFPAPRPAKKATLAAAPAAQEVPEELDLGMDLGGELTADDGGLALGANDDELSLDGLDGGLSLGEDIPADDGLSLEGADGLSLDAGDGPTLGDDPSDAGGLDLDAVPTGTMTSLKLGDEVNLGTDVLAKLQEIDEIMAKDATMSSMSIPDLGDEEADEGLVFNAGGPGDAEDLGLSLEGMEFAGTDELQLPSPAARPAPAPKAKSAPTPPEPEEEFAVAFRAEEEVAIPPPPAAKTAPLSERDKDAFKEVAVHWNAELERLQATLNHLRADREELLKKISAHDEADLQHQRLMLSLRAELDEKKIEVQLLKKRAGGEVEDLRLRAQVEQERRQLAEERLRQAQLEIQALQQKAKLDVRRSSGREQELEQQLELLRSDAETQIRHRDMKILELKRRLDAMEFEVENVTNNEKKSVEHKLELEDKLDKAIKTLRTAIGILELDDPKLASLEKLKKNLDV